MEEMQSEISWENWKPKRQVKEKNHKLPTQLRLRPTLENVWMENNEDDEINMIFVEHERNRELHDRANIAYDRVNQRQIPTQGAQVVCVSLLE